MMKNTFGQLGESYAINLIEKKGYKVIERNFRNKYGEIDIIAIDSDTLVFVEVKTRNGTKYGKPYEAVGSNKISRIKKMGSLYKKMNGSLPDKMRIDVVSIVTNGNKIIYDDLKKIT